MVPENKINEFLTRMREAAGENLESLILYGSAATGEYHPQYSNLNLLCILKDTSFPELSRLAPVAEWWDKQKHPTPLILTRRELQRSTDVFSIELLDIRDRHRVIYGEDVFAGLDIPMRMHRAQLEYELREKLILLRERLLLVGGKKERQWDLMQRSFPAFATLFRHALIALGEKPAASKREAIERLSQRLQLDVSAFHELLDHREKKIDARKLAIEDLFRRYLQTIEQVTAAVDTMLDSGEKPGS